MRKSTWLLSIFFLILGVLFTVGCSILGAVNAFSNPIQTILSVYGLVLWNGVAGGSSFGPIL